jgi:hypothetical protein
MKRRRAVWIAVGLLICPPSSIVAQKGAAGGEWRHYGGDLGGTKYSPLDQITPVNFSTLRMAWRWESADAQLERAETTGTWRAPAQRIFELLARENPKRWTSPPAIAGLQATPLLIDGVLYLSTAL